MPIRIETKDSTFTVIIDRPAVRNAVDGPTASALAEAFKAFDKDDAFSVAVLCGAGDTFQEALQNEFKHGMDTIQQGESVKGAARFSKGEGRHGLF